MIKEIKEGSIWRKWDLHIHTPKTHLNNKYNCSYELLAAKIKEEDLKVVGITNYFIVQQEEIDELKRLLPTDTLILANFEFRINDKNKDGEYINSHVLFNLEKVSITKILESLSRIPLNNISEDTAQYCTLENVLKYGADQITVSFDDLIAQLKEDFTLYKDFLLVGVNNGYGGFHPDKKPRNINLAKKMDKNSNLIFGKASDRNFFLNIEGPRKEVFKLPKPLFVCSDAHSIDDVGKEFTWVKADCTFEGLKQTIFEPLERTRIQENNPKFDFEKPYFSLIHFKENEKIFKDDEDLYFCQSTNELPLNPNLVTIIGGRGEGKSMLSEYVSSSFYGKTGNKLGDFNKTAKIDVEYSKTILNDEEKILFPLGDEEHSVDFIYISQGDLKSKVENRDKESLLAESISNLAKLEKPDFNPILDKLAIDSIIELQEIEDYLKKEENQIENLQAQEKKTNEFISNITTEENKEKLENYSKNLEKIKQFSAKRDELTDLLKFLSQNVIEINKQIQAIDEEETKIPLLKTDGSVYKKQLDAINDWLNELITSIADLLKINKDIKVSFNEVYKGDLSTLLKDVDKFQTTLLEIRSKILNVNKKSKRLDELKKIIFEESDSIISQIKFEYETQKNKLLQDWNNFTDFKNKDDLNEAQKEIMENLLQDLTVEVLIDFDAKKFYDKIYSCINGAVWRVKNNLSAQKDYFKINDLESFYDFLENRFIIECNNNGLDKECLTKIFFNADLRDEYIKVYPILKYNGKDLNKISVGQKGTVYLKLKLATEAFSKPIIFDQPEDDLDNEFIMNNLIDLFKELKKYRQVIIVTHNANLVINADAEQVIVATNDKGKLKYVAGSLENDLINKQICKILEGGELAFEKRRRKYKIQ